MKNRDSIELDGPNKLLDYTLETLGLRNDAALCRRIGVTPPFLSKMRNGRLPIGPTVLISIHEETGLSIAQLKSFLMPDPKVSLKSFKTEELLKKYLEREPVDIGLQLAMKAFKLINAETFHVSASMDLKRPESLANLELFKAILIMAYEEGQLSMNDFLS